MTSEKNQTFKRFEQTRETFCGSLDANIAGNGSLMHLEPVVLAYSGDVHEAVARAADSAARSTSRSFGL